MIEYNGRKVIKIMDSWKGTLVTIDTRHRPQVVHRENFDDFLGEVTESLVNEIYAAYMKS